MEEVLNRLLGVWVARRLGNFNPRNQVSKLLRNLGKAVFLNGY